MLTTYPEQSGKPSRDRGSAADDTVWLDLVDPSDEELERAAALLGADLPTRDQMSSIELSSRVRVADDMLRINIPAFARGDGGQGVLTPLGVLLTPALLVTVRYAESPAFDRLAKAVAGETRPGSSVDTFVRLFESVAGTAADHMQELSAELSQLSRSTFSDHVGHSGMLRGVLFQIGRIQRHVTQIRSALLGVQRGLSHVCDATPSWIGAPQVARLQVALGDLKALAEFDQQLDDKMQFLLDAALGFINNDQNDIMKVLTIVSVVTIPPVILAGIWGMNFKTIHEYDWPHGYIFALSLIVLSMLLPLAWFKWKRWF
ncbi:MAG TPA: CorA family divalent cation transporter [Rudaea sp.]|nr:CorA family divalent cation transporter [Rudaea sp.]